MEETPRRLLLIEDNPGDAELLREMLNNAGGAALETAERLSTGLKLLEEGAFDLVFTDLGLPDSSGIETFRVVRAKAPKLPIIVLTGTADEELGAQAIAGGAQDYLIKGRIDGDALARSLRYAVERKRAEEALRENELTLRSFYDSSPFLMGITEPLDNDILHVYDNPATCRFFGVPPGSTAGKRASELGAPLETIQTWLDHYRECERTGEPVTFEYPYSAAGEGSWLSVTVSRIGAAEGGRKRFSYVAQDITERKRMEEEIMHMALHDALTGLPNRRLFADLVALAFAEARRRKEKCAVLFLDLDRFKGVNDTLGHEAGDELLKEAARRLKGLLRASDSVARIGGDEFTIVLADILHAEDSAEVAREVVEILRRPFVVAGQELHMTASVGISIYPDDGEDIETLLRYADIAMYHAKESGRNNYQFFNPALNVRSLERMRLETLLRQAIDRGGLSVYYQPQVDIRAKKIIGAEALVRWPHPEQGMIEPREFLPLAEETGLIAPLDEWVLRTACSQTKAWQGAGLPPLCVTVNISARQFQQPRFAEMVAGVLNDTGLNPEFLELEITETVAMRDIEHALPQLHQLNALGVGFSLDDFGSGYTSLGHLKHLPVERLKIDRSFIRSLAEEDRAIITAVVAMAHTLNMRVVAEGVETEEQASFLTMTGCDEAQGFLISEPLPAEEFGELMRTS